MFQKEKPLQKKGDGKMPIALATPEGDNDKKGTLLINGKVLGDIQSINLNEEGTVESLREEGITKKRVHLTEDFDPLNDPLLDFDK